jgi:hypothetical protein
MMTFETSIHSKLHACFYLCLICAEAVLRLVWNKTFTLFSSVMSMLHQLKLQTTFNLMAGDNLTNVKLQLHKESKVLIQ